MKSILTNEDYENRNLSAVDRQLLDAAYGESQNLIEIKSMAQLREMADSAFARYQEFQKNIRYIMTKERAQRVYEFRVEKNYSWRLLAVACWSIWGDAARWDPPTNQLAGMALCDVAGEVLKIKIP